MKIRPRREALELYGKAIKLNPSYLVAYNNLAALYRKMGRETDAVSVYRKAIELNADSAEAYNSLGSVYKWVKGIRPFKCIKRP